MNTTKQFLILLLLLISIATFAQVKPEKPGEHPYIEVTGTAEKEVIPDEIYIAIILKEKTTNKIKVTIEEQEEKLKSAIKSQGIDLANLSLSDANADYIKVRWQQKDLWPKKYYTLKVSDAVTVGKVFQELEKLEVSDMDISKVSYSKLAELKKEIRVMAMKAAKEKADYLLSAIGEQTGKPLVVTENEMPSRNLASNIRNPSSETEYDSVKIKSNDSEIQFQKIKIQASIYVKFSIK